MKHLASLALLALTAQTPRQPALAPSEIVAAAPASDWVAITASDLMVMELTPLNGKPRRVVIQLIPPPFSQGWVGNIRKLAAARWWDGTSVNRVQDNYVVQWGDASEKALPEGLAKVPQSEYSIAEDQADSALFWASQQRSEASFANALRDPDRPEEVRSTGDVTAADTYSDQTLNYRGWPVAREISDIWPVHCYGMVGVGRGMPPDMGSGAELYTVIGHAPRHLDRNIALVGRVIEGIEHLSSLPRGTGALGFYERAEERVPIVSVRMGNEVKDLPGFEYLSTESESFARYADARANRRDAFFIEAAGGADICNIPVPVRRVQS